MVKMTVLGWKKNPEEAVLVKRPLCDHSLGLMSEFATSLFDSCVQFFVVNRLLGSEMVWIGACLQSAWARDILVILNW